MIPESKAMSAQILQRIYALSIHLLTSRTRGFFILTPYQYLYHSNLHQKHLDFTALAEELTFDAKCF